MASYWINLALVFCIFGTAYCGLLEQLDPDEAALYSDHLEDTKGLKLLLKSYMNLLTGKITALEDKFEELESAISGSQSSSDTDSASHESGPSPDLGAVYVRWGRTTCPEGTQLVYQGRYAGGSMYTHEGAAVNYLCLTTEPTWSKFTTSLEAIGALIYGAEYEFSQYSQWESLHDQEVPCAVCRAPRSSAMMVPGTNLCMDGWTLEYGGYLVAGHYKHKAASEYVCLDDDPEVIDGTRNNDNGVLFYFVQAVCGSLKCSEGMYEKGKELTCAVCTR